MEKKVNVIFYGIFVFCVLLAGIVFYKQDQKPKKEYVIALVVPAVHPSMDAIQEGFVTTAYNKIKNVRIDVYNANGNKVLLQGQLEKIVRSNCNLICCVGTNASQTAVTILNKHGKSTPLVALAVSPATSNELTRSYFGYSVQLPGTPGDMRQREKKSLVTGIVDHTDKKKQVEVLLACKDVKKPLLVYDPVSQPSFKEDRKEYEAIFKSFGITLDALPVYSMAEVYQKLAGVISQYDVVMTLTDHTVCSAMDAVITLCDKHGVTLYTSELDSSLKGAALSYGVHEREYGVKGAILAYKTRVNGYVPQSFEPNGPFYLKINKEACTKQGVNISTTIQLPQDVIIDKEQQ